MGNTALYQHIVDAITRRVEAGVYQPGQRLPPITALAEEFEVSPTTVKAAFLVLRERGVIRGQQGKATYVAEAPPAK
jgi:GntR family transcriptional regulator